MTDENKTTMTVRVDRDLAKLFKKIAKENNRNQAQLLRDFIKSYCEKNGQAEMFK